MATYSLHHEPPTNDTGRELLRWLGQYWFQIVVACFVWHMWSERQVETKYYMTSAATPSQPHERFPAAFVEHQEDRANPHINPTVKRTAPAKRHKSTDFNNLSFVLSPGLADKMGVPAEIVELKLRACRKYVERFAATAMSEQRQFGIPASITLAQGLLETDAGDSRIATESNNHFGIKCRSKCRHCTCRNYADDDAYDMFRVFDTAWESFREHSKLLLSKRYAHLKKLGTRDYKGWARGLKKAGYATDKHYDTKLIQIIEELDLHQFDK